MTDTDGYHPRAMLMVGLFGPSLRRASLLGLGAGLAAALAMSLILPATRYGPAGAIATWASFVVAGAAVALAAVPPGIRRAYGSFSWLGHRDTARFLRTTGSPVPVGARAARDWLAHNGPAPVTAIARLELLVALGQFDQARREATALPTPATDEDRLIRGSMRTYAEAVEHGEVDLEAFDALVATLPEDPALRLEAAVVRAIAETRVRAARGEPDPLVPLRAVRDRLGSEPTRIVLRDTWLPYLRQLVLLGLVAALVLGWGFWE